MYMVLSVRWNGARQIAFPEEPPSWKQEKNNVGGRLWERWRVVKACRLDIALLRRWTARRTWKLRSDSEIGKPFSKVKPITGSKRRQQKGRISDFDVRNLRIQLWFHALLVYLVSQLTSYSSHSKPLCLTWENFRITWGWGALLKYWAKCQRHRIRRSGVLNLHLY